MKKLKVNGDYLQVKIKSPKYCKLERDVFLNILSGFSVKTKEKQINNKKKLVKCQGKNKYGFVYSNFGRDG